MRARVSRVLGKNSAARTICSELTRSYDGHRGGCFGTSPMAASGPGCQLHMRSVGVCHQHEIGGCLPSPFGRTEQRSDRHRRTPLGRCGDAHRQARKAPSPGRCSTAAIVFTRSVMDKNTNSGAGVKSVEKKLDSKDDLLGANQQLRRPPPPQLPRDEPGGGIWTGMPASHQIGGCLPSRGRPSRVRCQKVADR